MALKTSDYVALAKPRLERITEVQNSTAAN
jgi:hypothetical protein